MSGKRIRNKFYKNTPPQPIPKNEAEWKSLLLDRKKQLQEIHPDWNGEKCEFIARQMMPKKQFTSKADDGYRELNSEA